MKSKIVSVRIALLAALIVAILAVVAISVHSRNRKPHRNPPNVAEATSPLPTQSSEPSSAPSVAHQEPISIPSATNAPADPVAEPGPKPRTAPKAAKAGGSGKKVFQDPLAREALSLVGLDPNAEQYWFAALGDPSLPQSERQDLVDDLNEEGLPDPKHPTLDDLPVILARLDILEEAVISFGGEVYDWKEPHDDLVNLMDLALGAGKPVQ